MYGPRVLPVAASDARATLSLGPEGALAFEQDGVPAPIDVGAAQGAAPIAVGLTEEHLLVLDGEALRLFDRDERTLDAALELPGERRLLVIGPGGLAAVGTSEGVWIVADLDLVRLPCPPAEALALDARGEGCLVRSGDDLVLVDLVELRGRARRAAPEGAGPIAFAPAARAFAVADASGAVHFFDERDLSAVAKLPAGEGEAPAELRATATGELEALAADGTARPVAWLSGGGAARRKLRARTAEGERSALWLGGALAFLCAVVLAPIAKVGIADPWELDAAELARRISLHWFGSGAAEPLPTLGDLRSGELPFTSMALGFRWLGLHDWSGRLPLALWSLGAVGLAFACVRRLAGARTALYASVLLGSMPLFFLHARVMLGDAVTIAASLGAFSALVAAFEAERPAARAGLGALGVALLAAGWMSRGWLVGVAPVALAAGLAPLLHRPRASRGRDLAAAALVALGLYAAARGVRLLGEAQAGGVLARGLGAAVLAKPEAEGTFDLPIRQLGHALFPLSALLPLAFGRLLSPPVGVFGEARERESLLRVAALLGLGASFGAHALLAARVGQIPFAGVGFAALALALVLRDLDRGAPASGAVAVGTAALAFVLHRDLTLDPARTLAPLALSKPSFPQGFEHTAKVYLTVAAVPLLLLVGLAWLGDAPWVGRSPAELLRARLARARASLRDFVTLWDGNAFFGLVVVEAALVGLGGMVFVGRKVRWAPTLRMSDRLADLSVNLWWVVPLAAALLPAAFVAARDAVRLVVARTRMGRGGATVAAAGAAGLILALGYYPALGAQLSPKDAFAACARLRKAGEPLAVLGVRPAFATYYGAPEVEAPSDPSSAFAFLGEGGEGRRWLVLRAEDLPRVNSLHRRRHGRNLPVLDASSALVLLASSDLAGERNANPLGGVVLDEEREPRFKLDAQLEDSLEVQGWELADEAGRPLDEVVPQRPFRVRVYYRVIGPVTGAWKAFLHVDKPGLRHTGDHALTEGRYPAALWQPGDRIVDEVAVTLEPNFVPGEYPLYFGLFAGDARMKVTRGPQVEDRVAAGNLRVR